MNPNASEPSPQSEAIRGDAITSQRKAKGDMELLGEGRGGARVFYARSALDDLLDNDVIDEVQRDYGLAYWRMREVAFAFLGAAANPIYGDMPGGDEEEATESANLGQSEGGASLETFVILSKLLGKDHCRTLGACCQASSQQAPLVTVWAFGERAIVAAFAALERHFTAAHEEYKSRLKRQDEAENPTGLDKGGRNA